MTTPTTPRFPNGPEGFVTTFKDIGSFVAIYDEIVAGTTGVETKLTAAVEQQDYDFGTVKSLSTFINNMVSVSNNLGTGKTNLVSAVTNYLTTVTSVDIGSTATTASGILADLIFVMQGATTGVAVSGIQILSGGQFDNYFQTEHGITMPLTSGSVYLSVAESMDLISGYNPPSSPDGSLPSLRRQIDDTYAD